MTNTQQKKYKIQYECHRIKWMFFFILVLPSSSQQTGSAWMHLSPATWPPCQEMKVQSSAVMHSRSFGPEAASAAAFHFVHFLFTWNWVIMPIHLFSPRSRYRTLTSMLITQRCATTHEVHLVMQSNYTNLWGQLLRRCTARGDAASVSIKTKFSLIFCDPFLSECRHFHHFTAIVLGLAIITNAMTN